MKVQITNRATGEVLQISRDVCTAHPAWVHRQVGSANETELQRVLDQYNVEDWYDSAGNHRGVDIACLEMFR